MIAIVDYGMGNLHSVQKALVRLGVAATVTGDPAAVLAAPGVILPGVGAFGDAMQNLRARGLDLALRETVSRRRPLLGICLGMQLLFDHSEEGDAAGLGLLPGRVRLLPNDTGLKVPHMGWNRLVTVRPNPLLADLPAASFVYFVHSYHVEAAQPGIVAAVTPYGREVTAVVASGSCYGTQFHPEKSGDSGMRILANFGRLVAGREVA